MTVTLICVICLIPTMVYTIDSGVYITYTQCPFFFPFLSATEISFHKFRWLNGVLKNKLSLEPWLEYVSVSRVNKWFEENVRIDHKVWVWGKKQVTLKNWKMKNRDLKLKWKNHLIGVEGHNENLPTAKNQEVFFFLFLLYLVCNWRSSLIWNSKET